MFTKNKFRELIFEINKLLKEFPKSFRLYLIKGLAQKNLNDFVGAISSLEKSIKINPEFAQSYNNYGVLLEKIGNYENALENYKKAISLNTKLIETYNNIGLIYKHLGDIELAKSFFEKAIDIDSSFIASYYNLSMLLKHNGDEKHINTLLSFTKKNELDYAQQTLLNFALGKIYEDLEDFDLSFYYYKKGNDSNKKNFPSASIERKNFFHFSKKQFLKYESIKNIQTNNIEASQFKPIFIIGMPRSGTTLVEQILSSHKKIFGCGELFHIQKGVLNTKLHNSEVNHNKLNALRNYYLQNIETMNFSESYFTDKMPLNFRYLGHIINSFPESIIIHLKRDPIATCWSNFKTNFDDVQLGYSNDLSELAEYFKLYEDLMDFWNKKFSDKIYELKYEDLVENQERETKQLIEHIGLEWDESCLNFHLNNRFVRTASTTQVREKIFKNSSLKWKKYEKHLDVLKNQFSSS